MVNPGGMDALINERSKVTQPFISKHLPQYQNDTNGGLLTHREEHYPDWKFWKKRRYIVVILAFFGFVNSHFLQANLSIAIVAMTEKKPVTLENGTTVFHQEFAWDSKMQGYILSSFFYGFVSTQLVSGIIASRIGGHKVFGYGIGIAAILTIITPWIIKLNVYLFLAIRAAEGVFEGVTGTCMHAVWAAWAPPSERSRMATFAYCGSFIGTVVSLPLCGFLYKSLGWPSIFYFSGTSALIWSLTWLLVVKRTPQEDKKISKEEIYYINNGLKHNTGKVVHPWKSIVISIPVWAIFAAHFAESWGYMTMLTQLPKFIKESTNFEITKTGAMSALPYLTAAFVLPLSGHCADWLRKNKILTTTQVRKLFTCGAFVVNIIFMMTATYWLTPLGSVLCLTGAIGIGVSSWSGFCINHLDIAPQHASVLMGISNTFGGLPGIISPILTGYIVTTSTVDEWKNVFYITSGIYLAGLIIYGTFGSGELQHWAVIPEPVESKNIKSLRNKEDSNSDKITQDNCV